jgi:hypothetical protein
VVCVCRARPKEGEGEREGPAEEELKERCGTRMASFDGDVVHLQRVKVNRTSLTFLIEKTQEAIKVSQFCRPFIGS